MKKNVVFVFILLVIALFWQGCHRAVKTGTIYGYVSDLSTGESIGAAGVELQPIGLKTTTGSDGWYQFSEVKAGEYEMNFSKTGYDIVKKSGIKVTEGPIRQDVKLVPISSFEYNDHVYMVAPDAGEPMTLLDANSYCHGLNQHGYADWRLPTKEELTQMYVDKESIGGFQNKVYWSSTWSSTQNSVDLYYVIHFLNGNVMEANPGSKLRVRPIRIK